jgi:hypothetical protein
MSKNIFKNSYTTKNTSNKGNNNRFSSLKDELNENPIENNVIPKKEKEEKREKSRFNFDDDVVNVFTDNNVEEEIKDTKEIRDTRDTRDIRDIRDTRDTRNTHNSFTALKPQVIKPVEAVTFVYNEELFPELPFKKDNIVTTEKLSFADKLKLKQTEIKKEEHVNTVPLSEKLKLKHTENIEENIKRKELKRIQEEKDYVKPGWVYYKRDPITKKMRPYYGENTQTIVKEKTLNEHMNYWIDGVVDRYLRRKEMLETVYGITDDYSPPEENNIEYFDMLDEKVEEELDKEEEEIINKYLNDNEEDYDNYETYNNDYWKKR